MNISSARCYRIVHVVRRLLPDGSDEGQPGGWSVCPRWPPDAFAVAAEIVNRSACHTRPRYLTGSTGGLFDSTYRERVAAAAKAWKGYGDSAPERVQELWRKIWESGEERLSGLDAELADAIIELMMICDEACS